MIGEPLTPCPTIQEFYCLKLVPYVDIKLFGRIVILRYTMARMPASFYELFWNPASGMIWYRTEIPIIPAFIACIPIAYDK